MQRLFSSTLGGGNKIKDFPSRIRSRTILSKTQESKIQESFLLKIAVANKMKDFRKNFDRMRVSFWSKKRAITFDNKIKDAKIP